MGVLGDLESVEADLRVEFVRSHVRAHVKQFAGLFAGALAVSLASGGWHVAGWAALGSLALAAAGAAARQVWPQVPWPAVLAVVRDAQDVADRPARPVAALSTPTIQAPTAPPGS